MALGLVLRGQDPRIDDDVFCTVLITFKTNEIEHQCDICGIKTSEIHININKIEVTYNPDGRSRDKIEERVKKVIEKIESKLKPNCFGENCFINFYNDFSINVHKRGHVIYSEP